MMKGSTVPGFQPPSGTSPSHFSSSAFQRMTQRFSSRGWPLSNQTEARL